MSAPSTVARPCRRAVPVLLIFSTFSAFIQVEIETAAVGAYVQGAYTPLRRRSLVSLKLDSFYMQETDAIMLFPKRIPQ